MMANVNKAPKHHNKFQANSIRSSQVIYTWIYGQTDRDGEIMRHISCSFFADNSPETM